MSDSYLEDETVDIDRWGCAIWIVAALLVAAQRVALFLVLAPHSHSIDRPLLDLHKFLFGEYPYSILDILFGFQIPDSGLLFIIQPHNWLIGGVQAVHVFLNFALVYCLLWFFSILRRAMARFKLVRVGTWVSSFLLVGVLATIVIQCRSSREAPNFDHDYKSVFAVFSDSDVGFEFSYPRDFSLTQDRDAIQGEFEELVLLYNYSMFSDDQMVGLNVIVQEDVIEDSFEHGSYEIPSEDELRSMVISEIVQFKFQITTANREAILEASQGIQITDIAGHVAATYEVRLEETPIGAALLQGALIISESQSVSFLLVGPSELDFVESSTGMGLKELWDVMLRSVSLE